MKRLAIVLVGVLLSNVAFSQGIEGKGIKGGLNIANLSGNDVKEAKSKIKGAFGGFLTYRLNEQIVIQPELLFSMKGGGEKITVGSPTVDTPTTYEVTNNLNYLEMPVLVKFSIPSQGNIKPFILAGPSLGILLSAKQKNTAEKDIKADTKSTDVGLVIGGGIDFPYQTCKLTADIRYTLGLTKLDKDNKKDRKNGAISIMAGCSF